MLTFDDYLAKINLLTEIVELRPPVKRVVKRNTISNPSTNIARKQSFYQYKTLKGNNVKLFFSPRGDDSYEVFFKVNDSIKDNGSTERDSEILASVFYLAKNKADQLGAKELHFEGIASDGDYKTYKNLDYSNEQKTAAHLIKDLWNKIKNYETKLIEPTESLKSIYQKLYGIDAPNRVDVDKEDLIKVFKKLLELIEKGHPTDFIQQSLTALKSGPFSQEIEKIEKAINDYSEKAKSHLPSGITKSKNRRKNIYEKIVNRHFADKWNIKIMGNYFVLTRI